MAMRTYGVETKGMILTLNELQTLLTLNKDNITYDFTDIDNVDFDEIIDFSYTINFATFIGEFNGYLDILIKHKKEFILEIDLVVEKILSY